MTNATHVTILDNSHDNVVGVRLQGKLDEDAWRSLAAALRPGEGSQKLARVLLELKSLKIKTPDEFWETITAGTPNLRDIERLAVICDDYDFKVWFEKLSITQFHGQVRSFEAADLRAAWQWIGHE